MKAIQWEPLALLPASVSLLFAFVALTDAAPSRDLARRLEAELKLRAPVCAPAAAQPGDTERRWVCNR